MKALKKRNHRTSKAEGILVIISFAFAEIAAWLLTVKLDLSGGGWFILALIAFLIIAGISASCRYENEQILEDEILHAFKEGYEAGYGDGKAGAEKDELIFVP